MYFVPGSKALIKTSQLKEYLIHHLCFITFPSTDVMPCVCRYIDQGRNPQLYTKECLERALARNEQVKGKIDTMTVRDKARVTEILHQ